MRISHTQIGIFSTQQVAKCENFSYKFYHLFSFLNIEHHLKVGQSIGMLHIGVVFVVFGAFLLGAGLIPDDASAMNAWSIFAKDSWWNELVLTGLFAIGLGLFLIILNSVISKKEDDDLERYVQSQLTRSRSGKIE